MVLYALYGAWLINLSAMSMVRSAPEGLGAGEPSSGDLTLQIGSMPVNRALKGLEEGESSSRGVDIDDEEEEDDDEEVDIVQVVIPSTPKDL